MKRQLLLLVVLAALCSTSCGNKCDRALEPVNFTEVSIDDSFWNPIFDRHKEVTLDVCIDQIENQTGRIRNFENAAKREGAHSGIFFDDSDVYKALEGMAYSLQLRPDPELEAKCDEWIDKFAAAQLEDGYLYTFYTLTGLDGRWTDCDKHEMYCAGHMIEAAVAYYKATGKRKFLDVAIGMADYMMTVFGPGKRDWVPGHEEIELALVKLYDVTGRKKYLDFAEWLLEERGHGHFVGPDRGTSYYQDNVPVNEISEICGHAVRAMYLYCGMADVAALKGRKDYVAALERVWSDVVERNMYITGGIGSSWHNEGFTEDYDLPNKEAYCETCASVGMILWNWRMNLMSGDSKYADVVERALYNGAIDGMSLSGDRFFYVNPLESDGNHHRQAWYGCACCPSQVCRFIPSIGNYIYARSADALYVNLFISSETDGFKMETGYPYESTVAMTFTKNTRKALKVRIPGWCGNYTVDCGDKDCNETVESGYLCLDASWKEGDKVTVTFDMPVEAVSADPRVKADLGRRAVCRGPLVYCIEEIDNPSTYDLPLTGDTTFETSFDTEKLGGIMTITDSEGHNYIPYFTWDNREASRMQVWLPIELVIELQTIS
ncbi:MAG: glycoside hydrolase family 127 protein [Bacteroidales bacterium]|nr:glycoside hydrolase family 127 protein [Bacteroidales bacterium]